VIVFYYYFKTLGEVHYFSSARVRSGVAGLLRVWPAWVILTGSPSSRSTSTLAAPPGDDLSAPVRRNQLKLDADGLSLGAACGGEDAAVQMGRMQQWGYVGREQARSWDVWKDGDE
jgi:hypothetical protein